MHKREEGYSGAGRNNHEKKDDPAFEKGDKGQAAEQKERELADNPSQQAGAGDRGGHRRRTGGNPDGS